MKNKLILIGMLLLLLYFISCPQDAFAASCSGILLWFEQILPSLLPYSILSNIILASGLFTAENHASCRASASGNHASRGASASGNHASRRAFTNKNRHSQQFDSVLRPVQFPISPAEFFVMICGFAFGFPIGSRLAADLCSKGIIPRERAQLLAAFTNNMSPAFVSNYVLAYSLNRADLLIPTYLLLYGIPLVYGVLGLCVNTLYSNRNNTEKEHGMAAFGRRKSPAHYDTADNSKGSMENTKPASRFHIDMQIVDAGITQSFETLIRLCGYIVIFSILAHFILHFSFVGKGASILLTGILEVTNGIGTLPTSGLPGHIRYLLAVGFLSFGGISGMVQTGSMIRPAGLSLRSYCRRKLIITILVLLATAVFSLCLSL